jgi:hypothetical protein
LLQRHSFIFKSADIVVRHIWWFVVCGAGLALSSELLSHLQPPTVLSAVMGLAGYVIVAVAIAAMGVASGGARWFLITSGLICVVGVLFILPHRPRDSLGIAATAMLASAGLAFWRLWHRRDHVERP